MFNSGNIYLHYESQEKNSYTVIECAYVNSTNPSVAESRRRRRYVWKVDGA